MKKLLIPIAISYHVAIASWYGAPFFGRHTANMETYTPYTITVAHKTLPFNTIIEFKYNGKVVYARVNDRGPYIDGREFDLSAMTAKLLGFSGVNEIEYKIIYLGE